MSKYGARQSASATRGPRPHSARPPRGAAFIAAVAVAAIVSTGCSALYQPPEVRLEGVRLTGLGLRGGTIEADVVLSNPNRYTLRSSELAWVLELAETGEESPVWSTLATGRLDRELEIPARDSVVVGLPIDFAWDGVGSLIRSLLERGTFDYRVSGALELHAPISRTVPYRRTGTLSLGR